MGETITATLTMLDENLPHTWQKDVFDSLIAITGHSLAAVERSTESQTISVLDQKWYFFERNLEELSKSFSCLRMELLVEHGSGAQTLIYAYGGKVQVEPGRVEFGPCTLWS